MAENRWSVREKVAEFEAASSRDLAPLEGWTCDGECKLEILRMTRATSRAASRPAGVPPRGKTTFGGVSSSRRCGAPLFAPLVHGCSRVGSHPSQIEGRREEQSARCTGEDLLLRAQGDQLGERMSDGQQRGQKTKKGK
jgi:hypothetical protein